MSMLSANCERLRDRAKELRSLKDGLTAPYVVPPTKETMALAMQSAASELEDAADTIWHLRNLSVDVQAENDDLKAENAELQEKLSTVNDAYDVVSAACREKAERINDLEDVLARHGLPTGGRGVNAKLRELCGELASELRGLGVDFSRIGWCFLRDELRELGVEVGE